MARSNSLPLASGRHHVPAERPDRLHVAIAAPIIVLLSLLCWAAVWEAARLVF